jgi:hypothetical protein
MRSSTTSRRLGGEFRHNPQFCEVASGASDKQNKGEARGAFCGKSERSERFPQNSFLYEMNVGFDLFVVYYTNLVYNYYENY